MVAQRYFTPETFSFLRDLAKNNNRDWFNENKGRYESQVKDPAVRFIVDVGPALNKISPHFRADPRANGGSLFRIYRDTRFSKDKTPFKTHTGIQFRHEAGKDVHAPGFYLHIHPQEIFIGVGIWHPDPKTLRRIRDQIVEDPAGWKRARGAKAFKTHFELGGDSLVRAPKGYDPEHPLIDDLRRKDFIAGSRMTQKDVTSPDFLKTFAARCRAAGPFQKWLCGAVGVAY
ncbi:MAG: DUF2461 domain-containing protein [Gemmatimonadota bacterium]|nr:DUF2461 domain-containing protein [Gemmatimonadota bacterium]